jgi:hypothetical protein
LIIFGVKVDHPTPQKLGLATAIILGFLLFSLAGSALGIRPSGDIFPMLAGVATSVIAAAFGISPMGGWRACVLLMLISLVAYAGVVLVTGQ